MALRITEIPAEGISERKGIRKAAAYARVSTSSDEQATSYSSQVEYYTDFINGRADMEFVGVYTDEGVSGTSTTRRAGFRRMIADALAGKIDLIITKSVSRFARNAADSLYTISLLKEHNVECYFEKENISTFDAHGELMLTIMAGIAQEESRSISENIKWGQKRRFADGKFTCPYRMFLGYDRGEDGRPIINERQAALVRRIYEMFLDGVTVHKIAKTLTAERIPTPSGKEVWSKKTIKNILTNEKYKGDALLQKVYTESYLTKKKRKNNGEKTRYYVEESHEAIIPPDVWERVQQEMERRRILYEKRGNYSGNGSTTQHQRDDRVQQAECKRNGSEKEF